MRKRNGINIELTQTQYDYLYEVIMFAYEMDVPEQKGWDVQTYDNMVDNVTNGQSTILSAVSYTHLTLPTKRIV